MLSPVWAIPTLLLSGTSAAVGIALVNAIGNVGGCIGPFVIGYLRTKTGGDNGAFVALGVMAHVGLPPAVGFAQPNVACRVLLSHCE